MVREKVRDTITEMKKTIVPYHSLLSGLELAEPGCGIFLASWTEAHALVLLLRAAVEAVQHVLEVAGLEVRDEIAVVNNWQNKPADNKYWQPVWRRLESAN